MEGKKLYFLLVVCVIIIFSGCVISTILTDREPPEIIISEAGMVDLFTDDMDVKDLLKGVTAYDERDGDVTDSLSIVNLVVINDRQSIQVTYAASDKRNNIAQKSKKISYSGTKDFINISLAQEDTADNTPNESGGDTTVEPIETPNNNDTTQEQTTEPQPSQQEGGSGTPVKIDKAAVDATGIPQIELKYTDYTLHKGESFTTATALNMVNDTYDDSEDVSNRIVINGLEEIDTNTLGDYELSYLVSDKKGNRSEARKLVVHVIE